MLPSPSPSFPDIRSVAAATSPQRIRRKPPPSVVAATDRYPTPDPADPFAPLWVLRNRTSSALGFFPPVSPSQEALDTSTISERRHSISYTGSVSSPLSAARPSPPASPAPSILQRAHYVPYSQSRATTPATSPPQRFPLLGGGHMSRPSTPDVRAYIRSPATVGHPDDIFNGGEGSGAESDASTASEMRFRPNVAYLARMRAMTSAAALPTVAIRTPLPEPEPLPRPRTAGSGGVRARIGFGTSKIDSAAKMDAPTTSRMGLARFLVPRRRTSAAEQVTPSVARAEGGRARSVGSAVLLAPAAKVRKASISAPQVVSSTVAVAWDVGALALDARSCTPRPAPRIQAERYSAHIWSEKDTIRSDEGAGLDNVSKALNSTRAYDECAPPERLEEIQRSSTIDGQAISIKQHNSNGVAAFDDDHISEKSAQNTKHNHDRGAGNYPPGAIISQHELHLKPDKKRVGGGHPHANIDTSSTTTTTTQPSKTSSAPRAARSFSLPLAISNLMQRATSPTTTQRRTPLRPLPKPTSTRDRVRPTTSVMGPRHRGHARAPSLTPLTLAPEPPSIHSVSGTSLVSISLPSSPVVAPHETEEAFTSPRAAPSPPSESPAAESPPALRSPEAPTDIPVAAPEAEPAEHVKPIGEWDMPTEGQLRRAAALSLTSEDGTSVRFGALFAAHRTAIVFIRHFWCPLCQDYMAALRARVRPAMLARWADASPEERQRGRLVGFVVIGHGAPAMIRKYRQMFGLPFAVYTDPTRAVYRALGMGRGGDDGHRHLATGVPQSPTPGPRPSGEEICEASTSGPAGRDGAIVHRTGGYVKHGLVSGIALVVVRALRVRMPVWEKGGDIAQLGGEFVLGPGLTCAFAHRMQTTRGHAPIDDVLAAAGVDLAELDAYDALSPAGKRELRESIRASLLRGRAAAAGKHSPTSPKAMTREEEEEAWMLQRAHSIARLQARKEARRRAGAGTPVPRSAPPALRTPLSVVGEAQEERDSAEEDSGGRRVSFADSIEEEEGDDEAEEDAVPVRPRWHAGGDTESCYSSPSGEAGDYVYADTTETEEESWKDEEEPSVGPMTSYLFIR